jgi:uncharacterized protein YjiS (DUF1127 family)
VTIFRFVVPRHPAQIHLTPPGASPAASEDRIMTCLPQTAPLAPRAGASFLLGLLASWQRHAAAARTQRRLAMLDDRALCDLGLSRDVVDPPHPSDAAGLWLNRIPG